MWVIFLVQCHTVWLWVILVQWSLTSSFGYQVCQKCGKTRCLDVTWNALNGGIIELSEALLGLKLRWLPNAGCHANGKAVDAWDQGSAVTLSVNCFCQIRVKMVCLPSITLARALFWDILWWCDPLTFLRCLKQLFKAHDMIFKAETGNSWVQLQGQSRTRILHTYLDSYNLSHFFLVPAAEIWHMSFMNSVTMVLCPDMSGYQASNQLLRLNSACRCCLYQATSQWPCSNFWGLLPWDWLWVCHSSASTCHQ